ncbi:chemotaxis protein CheB [Desertivirga brevis]|uniref:chemotaxis protein CheB n=1 Tax=Desertivirga brevis TaxID=2810310 RepID=UPI001A95C2E4|nr:chemotaxis protein CheB [Pedobacter sp. SYSU D00873]
MEKDSLRKIDLVLIGGSAGSLEVILRILPDLKKDLPFAIIIIIHRKSSFESTLTALLASRTSWEVKEAEEKEDILPGIIYLAPADYHLLIEDDRTLSLDYSEKILHSRPAIDATFQTAADVYKDKTAAFLLSGANADGSAGLKAIQQAGGLTIVQDPEEAEIKYMPAQALSKMKPDYILSKYKMAELINQLGNKSS